MTKNAKKKQDGLCRRIVLYCIIPYYTVVYCILLVRYFFYICSFWSIFRPHVGAYPPPSLKSSSSVEEILTHMLRFGFLGREPGTSIKERIVFCLRECLVHFHFWEVIMDVDPCTYHFRSLKSGALVTPCNWKGDSLVNLGRNLCSGDSRSKGTWGYALRQKDG